MPRRINTKNKRVPKRYVKKKRNYAKKRSMVTTRKMVIPRSVTRQNMLLPPLMKTTVMSNAYCYANGASGAAASYIDVQINSLRYPWAQTVAYDTATNPHYRSAVDGTVSSATNVAEGLSYLLGADQFYQSYMVSGATLTVKIIPENDADTCAVCIVPWKIVDGKSDTINSTVFTAGQAPLSKSWDIPNGSAKTLKYSIACSKILGRKLEDTERSLYSSVPANGVYLRILYAKHTGGAFTGNIGFHLSLKQSCHLTNMVIGGLPE